VDLVKVVQLLFGRFVECRVVGDTGVVNEVVEMLRPQIGKCLPYLLCEGVENADRFFSVIQADPTWNSASPVESLLILSRCAASPTGGSGASTVARRPEGSQGTLLRFSCLIL
jgi:hypothetical protein